MSTTTLLQKMSDDRKFKILPDHSISQPLRNTQNLNYINQLKSTLSETNHPTSFGKELDDIIQLLDVHSKKIASNIQMLQVKSQQDDPKKLLKRISSYKRNLTKTSNFGVIKRKKLSKLFTELEEKYQSLFKKVEAEKKIAQTLTKMPTKVQLNSIGLDNSKLNNDCQEKGCYYSLTEPSNDYNVLPEILLLKHHLLTNQK